MKTGNDIFEHIGKGSFSVPDGYFDSLKERLGRIPEESSGAIAPTLWMRVKPYAALAACFLAALVAGKLILSNTAGGSHADPLMEEYGELFYSDLIPVTQPAESLFYEYESAEGVSEDDIINYLIETGTTAEQLAMADLHKQTTE
ncbi:MAG: hypothetical protein II029_02105 [Bacteroidales bacterium]|jgi:hypothetical protein|nr:hypothetical protein [Bacteroidales bacterium]